MSESTSHREREQAPDWWQRDHPQASAIGGFLAGMAVVILVPALFAAVLQFVVGLEAAEELFPFALLALVVPVGLMLSQRTRRFGAYMALGMVLSAVVVVAVAALVLWLMVRYDA